MSKTHGFSTRKMIINDLQIVVPRFQIRLKRVDMTSSLRSINIATGKKHFGRGKSSTFLKDFLIAMLEYPMIFCWWKGVLNCPWGPMKIQDVPEATPARPSCFMVPRMAVTTWGQGSRCQPKFTTFGLVLKHEIPAHNS